MRLTPDRWGELLDFLRRPRDLEDGIIRVLHSLSFVEDPTRILRAARFEQRFQFHIEPRTEELIGGGLDLLERVSAERMRHELELILAEVQPERAICRLQEMGVLTELHPALRCETWFVSKAAELRSALRAVRDPAGIAPPPMDIAPDATPRLYLALLLSNLPQAATIEVLDRLRVRAADRELALEVARLTAAVPGLKDNAARPSDVVAILDETSDEARLALRVACDDWLVRQRLDSYQRRWRHAQPLLNGDDLRKMGIPPGRIYRRILETLRAARLNGAVSSRADEEELARRISASPDNVPGE
jgi:tRNA nucleotidyltransferase (CCA-adding enzyme)